MKIAILSRSSGLYSTSRLKEAAVERGRASLRGTLAAYRHSVENRPRTDDATELRGSVSFRIGFGTEPAPMGGSWRKSALPREGAR